MGQEGGKAEFELAAGSEAESGKSVRLTAGRSYGRDTSRYGGGTSEQQHNLSADSAAISCFAKKERLDGVR